MSNNKSTAKSSEFSSQVDQHQEHKGRRALLATVGAGLTVVALAACSAEAHPGTNPNTQHPVGNNSTSSPEKTGSPKAENIAPPTPLSSETYPTAAALTPAFIKGVVQWYNAGSGEKAAQAAVAAGTVSGYVDSHITTLDNQAEAALIDTASLPTHPGLSNFVTATKAVHNGVLDMNLLTTDSQDSNDKAPYERNIKIVDAKPATAPEAGEIAEDITFQSVDNRSQNRAHIYWKSDADINTLPPEEATFVWANVDGNWKLTDVQDTHSNN